MKQDRQYICEVISRMLDNPNENGIYPTTEVYDMLENFIHSVRVSAVGWAWAEACSQLDKGKNPRTYDMGELIVRIEEDFSK